MATMMSRGPNALFWLGFSLLAACSDVTGPAIEAGVDPLDGRKPKSQPTEPAPPPPTTPGTNPLLGAVLYVEPTNNALTTAALWKPTRPTDAALLEGIGKTAQAVWFGGWNADIKSATSNLVSAATNAGRVPVLVAYNIPQRDCGSYSAGGASSAEAYLTWIRGFAAGIGARKAAVILEPDALAGMGCLTTADRERRVFLLSEAVRILKANAATAVYLDGGHARWISASEMSKRLLLANVALADGFSLNVSNFVTTNENLSYGTTVSGLTGGKHFVIDTSRNGQGPTATNEWCNPSGRGLGISPTTATGNTLVDALLWIKRPGESDGPCNGGPSAGKWWPEYALGLAQRATSQVLIAAN